MPIAINDASVKDLDRLHHIEQECFKDEAFSKQQLASLLKSYNGISLVARERLKIIGFIIGTLEFEDNILVGHVLTIDVSFSCRGRGVGQSLLESLEKILATKDVRECRLEVREGNTEALLLYAKAGYKKTKRLPAYYGQTDGFLLTKQLR